MQSMSRNEIFDQLLAACRSIRDAELREEITDSEPEPLQPPNRGLMPKILTYLQAVQADLLKYEAAKIDTEALQNRLVALEKENEKLKVGFRHFKEAFLDGEVPSAAVSAATVATPVQSLASARSPTTPIQRSTQIQASGTPSAAKRARVEPATTTPGSKSARTDQAASSALKKNVVETTPKKALKITPGAHLSMEQKLDLAKQFKAYLNQRRRPAKNEDFQKVCGLTQPQVYEVIRLMKGKNQLEKHDGTSVNSTWRLKG